MTADSLPAGSRRTSPAKRLPNSPIKSRKTPAGSMNSRNDDSLKSPTSPQSNVIKKRSQRSPYITACLLILISVACIITGSLLTCSPFNLFGIHLYELTASIACATCFVNISTVVISCISSCVLLITYISSSVYHSDDVLVNADSLQSLQDQAESLLSTNQQLAQRITSLDDDATAQEWNCEKISDEMTAVLDANAALQEEVLSLKLVIDGLYRYKELMNEIEFKVMDNVNLFMSNHDVTRNNDTEDNNIDLLLNQHNDILPTTLISQYLNTINNMNTLYQPLYDHLLYNNNNNSIVKYTSTLFTQILNQIASNTDHVHSLLLAEFSAKEQSLLDQKSVDEDKISRHNHELERERDDRERERERMRDERDRDRLKVIEDKEHERELLREEKERLKEDRDREREHQHQLSDLALKTEVQQFNRLHNEDLVKISELEKLLKKTEQQVTTLESELQKRNNNDYKLPVADPALVKIDSTLLLTHVVSGYTALIESSNVSTTLVNQIDKQYQRISRDRLYFNADDVDNLYQTLFLSVSSVAQVRGELNKCQTDLSALKHNLKEAHKAAEGCKSQLLKHRADHDASVDAVVSLRTECHEKDELIVRLNSKVAAMQRAHQQEMKSMTQDFQALVANAQYRQLLHYDASDNNNNNNNNNGYVNNDRYSNNYDHNSNHPNNSNNHNNNNNLNNHNNHNNRYVNPLRSPMKIEVVPSTPLHNHNPLHPSPSPSTSVQGGYYDSYDSEPILTPTSNTNTNTNSQHQHRHNLSALSISSPTSTQSATQSPAVSSSLSTPLTKSQSGFNNNTANNNNHYVFSNRQSRLFKPSDEFQ